MQKSNIVDLIERAKKGDNDAFADIQAQYERRIQSFVRRIIASDEDTEDIVQRTFIALYMNIDQIDPPEKLRPFLFRVARNLSYDALRKFYRRDEVTLDDCEYYLATDITSTENKVHWSLLLEKVRQVIACLPLTQRETLLLYIEEGFSQAEIAEVMNTEVGTVKSRLYYARKLLRQTMPFDLLATLREIDK